MKKMTLLPAAGLLSITAAACGGQQAQTDQNDDSGSSNTSNSPGQTQTGGTDADDDMQQTSELPQGFALPVPDDYQVQRAGETKNETAMDLQVPDGQQAYDFYEQTLHDDFTIEDSEIDNDSTNFDADIDFDSADYDGSLDFSGDTVEIDLDNRTFGGDDQHPATPLLRFRVLRDYGFFSF